MSDKLRVEDGAGVGVLLDPHERVGIRTFWTCEKWEQDKIDHVARKLLGQGVEFVRDGRLMRPVREAVTSPILRSMKVTPDDIAVVEGNLLLNEGIGRLITLLIASGGTAYNNANSYIGVGDSNTAEAASQVELQAATNRFYKAMVATFPATPGSNGANSIDWRSDFTSTEANYAWAEWSIAAGATTASGAGFTTGTTNLNRKVQSLGTKSTGTWTLTGTVTFS